MPRVLANGQLYGITANGQLYTNPNVHLSRSPDRAYLTYTPSYHGLPTMVSYGTCTPQTMSPLLYSQMSSPQMNMVQPPNQGPDFVDSQQVDPGRQSSSSSSSTCSTGLPVTSTCTPTLRAKHLSPGRHSPTVPSVPIVEDVNGRDNARARAVVPVAV